MGTYRYRNFLLFTFSSAFLIPLLGTFLLAGLGLKGILKADAAAKFSPLIQAEAQYMGKKIDGTGLLFRHLAWEFSRKGPGKNLKDLLGYFHEEASTLERVEILDLQGNLLFSHPENPLSGKISRLEDPVTVRALESGEFQVSSSYLSRETGKPTASAALIQDNQVVYGRLNLESLSQSLKSGLLGLPPEADLFFTDSQGITMVHRDYRKVLRRESFLPLRDVLNQETGEVKVLWDPVDDSLLLGVSVPHSTWYGILLLPEGEIFGPMNQYWRMVLIFTALGWGAAAALSLFTAGRMEKSIRALTRDLQALTGGRPLPSVRGSAIREVNDLQNTLEGLGESLHLREEAFRKQLEELEGKKSELTRFTQIMSQDLKGPLITIRGFMGHLQKDWDQQNAQRFQDDIRRVEKATTQMQNLLEDLLHFNRSTDIGDRFQTFKMHAAFRSALDRLSPDLPSKCIVYPPDPWPTVYGDFGKIAEVWKALLENSLKFRGEAPPELEAGWKSLQDELVFFLKDNGMGIDPAYHEKIFDLFEKLDPVKSGAGIGLALAKRIVTFHQGRIWVDSEGLGKGTTFLFTLPFPPSHPYPPSS